jgi:hypothetical protein
VRINEIPILHKPVPIMQTSFSRTCPEMNSIFCYFFCP